MAEISSIRESRGPDSRCEISLKFKGDILSHYGSILGVRVTKAIDDTGQDLCPTNGHSFAGLSTAGNVVFTPLRGWHQERASQTRYGHLSLRGSNRAAKTIKALHGELELFSPSLENGGVIVVENFRAQPGAELQSAALQKIGVRLIYHSKESFESVRNSGTGRNPQDYSSTQRNGDESGLFPGVLGYPEDGPRNYVVLEGSDPEKKLAGFAFLGPDGRFLPVGRHRSVGNLHAFTFVLPVLPEKLDLYVYLATPGAVESVPFELKNVPLP